MSKKEPKVAIVHDWLVGYAGGDRVVDAMKRVFPDAVIYTLVYDPKNMPEHFKGYDIRTSWFQKVPFSNRLYKAMLPLMPRAFEAFDLTEYDLVLSSSSSCSKGVITRPDAVHICYCHTPIRYVWDFYYTYRDNANWLAKLVMPGQTAQNAHLGQVRRGPRGLFHRQLALYRPAHQKNITGVTAMSFTPAATSTSRLLSKRRTST